MRRTRVRSSPPPPPAIGDHPQPLVEKLAHEKSGGIRFSVRKCDNAKMLRFGEKLTPEKTKRAFTLVLVG
jgi:hypothetical protein